MRLNACLQFRSTPPRRGDTDAERYRKDGLCFDPRPREGATRAHIHGIGASRVSIHAPAKGRLGVVVPLGLGPRRFRSTPPRRGDEGIGGHLQVSPVSIHAPAKGRRPVHHHRSAVGRVSIHAPAKGRQGDDGCHGGFSCFDPRPREGATAGAGLDQGELGVSIHAPAKGRPRPAAAQGPDPAVSIHAPAKGRPRKGRREGEREEFRSTPPRRGDRPK